MALDDAATAAEIDAAGVALCRAGVWAKVAPQVAARPGRARAEAVLAALRCARLERADELCAPMSCHIAWAPGEREALRQLEAIRRAQGAQAPGWGALDAEARLTLTTEAPATSGWPVAVHQGAMRQLARELADASNALARERWCAVYGRQLARRAEADATLWAEAAHTSDAARCLDRAALTATLRDAARPRALLRALSLTGDPGDTTRQAKLWHDLLMARWSCAQRREVGMAAAALASIAPQVHARLDAAVWQHHHAQLALTCAPPARDQDARDR